MSKGNKRERDRLSKREKETKNQQARGTAREEKREAGRNESETERQGGREGERQSGGRRRKALINTALLLKCCLEDKQLFPAKLSECSGRQLSRTERGREIDG